MLLFSKWRTFTPSLSFSPLFYLINWTLPMHTNGKMATSVLNGNWIVISQVIPAMFLTLHQFQTREEKTVASTAFLIRTNATPSATTKELVTLNCAALLAVHLFRNRLLVVSVVMFLAEKFLDGIIWLLYWLVLFHKAIVCFQFS